MGVMISFTNTFHFCRQRGIMNRFQNINHLEIKSFLAPWNSDLYVMECRFIYVKEGVIIFSNQMTSLKGEVELNVDL